MHVLTAELVVCTLIQPLVSEWFETLCYLFALIQCIHRHPGLMSPSDQTARSHLFLAILQKLKIFAQIRSLSP